MRIHKVYTRTGDDGTTALVGGERVPKESLRVESYGTVDELQSVLGVLRSMLAESLASGEHEESGKACREMLSGINTVQQALFDLGSGLSTPPGYTSRMMNPITEERIAWLEETMDRWNLKLAPLKSFVLSGGGRFSAQAHVARTVCRRCERVVLRLGREEPVPTELPRYLNRLSDFLFVLARNLARELGEDEPLWETPLMARE